MGYAIITPARNEENFIEKTILSVVSQTLKPSVWIIVDDASTDATYRIAKKYAKKYPWIRVKRRETTSGMEKGSVPEIFMEEYRDLKNKFDFIVKLDADVSLPPDYFERLFEKFKENPSLGIAGGGCYQKEGNEWKLEKAPLSHVRGATKVYRRKCLEDIGGLVPHLGWDTIDEVKAWMHGWETRSFPEIPFYHHRKSGTRDGSLKGYIRMAEAAYYMGYFWLFFVLRVCYRIFSPPYLIGALAMLFTYVNSYLHEKPLYPEKEVRRFIKKEQVKRLLGRESLWK